MMKYSLSNIIMVTLAMAILTACSKPQAPAPVVIYSNDDYSHHYAIAYGDLSPSEPEAPKENPEPTKNKLKPYVLNSIVVIAPEPTLIEPEHPLVLLPEAAGKTDDSRVKVALLLPLSGSSNAMGQQLLQAAHLAIFDSDKTYISLLPIDTYGTEDGAIKAVQKAIDQQVKLIIGPLYSHTSHAIAPLTQQHNIPVISFSTDHTLARNPAMYNFGFLPSEQITRVLTFAYQQGITNFSALLPNNTYGIEVARSLKDFIAREQLFLSGLEYYQGANAKLSESIQRLTILPEGIDEEEIYPADSEGMLVPDSNHMLMALVNRLRRPGVDSKRFRLLGSGRWDEAIITKEPKLIGSWFAAPPPEQRILFETHFKATYDHPPIRIASLAYDAVALANALQGDYSHATLTLEDGYTGVNGVFRINDKGLTERGLAVIEITKEGLTVIDPAPKGF